MPKARQRVLGLERPPYRNELGKRIYEEVSKEAWEMWKRDSVKFINTYRVDLTSPAGQKFMFDQCAVYSRRMSRPDGLGRAGRNEVPRRVKEP